MATSDRSVSEPPKNRSSVSTLIAGAVLGVDELEHLIEVAREVGMEPLVEVHSARDVEVALATDAKVVGINNRDLATFETSLATTLDLAPKLLADGRIVVCESGISRAAEVELVGRAGVRAFLVGEALMQADDPGEVLDELLDAEVGS